MKKLCILVVRVLMVSLVLGSFVFMDIAQAADPSPKPREIKIAGGRVGDPWYVFSEALAYFINHGSKWLKAGVVPTPGLTGNYELGMESPGDYIMLADVDNVYQMTKDPGFIKRYKGYDKVRFIALANSITYVWVTLDKRITKGQDLAGKTFSGARIAASTKIDEDGILKAWGVDTKVKRIYSSIGERVTQLKDGLINVATITVDHIYPSTFAKGAALTDLETRGTVYFISVDPKIQDRLRDQEGVGPLAPVRIPPNALGPNMPPNEVWGYTFPMYFSADERMDSAIVYEVTRIIWENAGKWASWHAQGAHMTKEMIPASPVDLKYIHPGAKKYYDEQGIKVKELGPMLR